MKRIIIFQIVVLTILTSACNNSKSEIKTEKSKQDIDTTGAVKIDKYWISPKPSLEFNSVQKISKDTLSIVVCSEYVYSPFGNIENKSKFESSILKKFSVTNRTDSLDVGKFEFNILKLNNNKLIFFFDNDPEASKHSNILKGEINSKEVKFINGVRVGMGKNEFYKVFFNDISNELIKKYNYLVLESCVQDIKHIYSFKDDKLLNIKFITDTYWTVNY